MVNKAIIFDSNVWIGYFNTTDTTHAQAVAYFKKYSEQTVILTEYVLLEVATVLKQKIGDAATNKILTLEAGRITGFEPNQPKLVSITPVLPEYIQHQEAPCEEIRAEATQVEAAQSDVTMPSFVTRTRPPGAAFRQARPMAVSALRQVQP